MENKVTIAKPILDDLQKIMNEGISIDSSIEYWRCKHNITSEDWANWNRDNREVLQGMIRQEIVYKRSNRY